MKLSFNYATFLLVIGGAVLGYLLEKRMARVKTGERFRFN